MNSSAQKYLLATLTCLLLGLLAGCSSLKQSLKNQECLLDTDQPFDVVTVDLNQHDVRLYWKRPDGTPFLTLEALQTWIAAQGDSLIAATNAGIYEPGYIPTGLFIENGITQNPLNPNEGAGNFFLKPNGVFLITNQGARIVETSQFEDVVEPVRYATQSGPLLLREEIIHPAFNEGSKNCRLRSGVGVDKEGTIYLVISNGAVNFWDFATYFRDTLNCTDALYLDGGISHLYAPSLQRTSASRQKFAGIIGVLHKTE